MKEKQEPLLFDLLPPIIPTISLFIVKITMKTLAGQEKRHTKKESFNRCIPRSKNAISCQGLFGH